MSKHMNFVGVLSFVALSLLLVYGPAAAESAAKAHVAPGKNPVAALKPITDNGQMQIGETDRCPVCGMFPAKRPKTAAAMMLVDGRTYYFCGNGCLLRTWHAAPDYLNVPRESIQRMVVRDYFTGESINAFKAWWVAGSDVVGPMGPAMVALQSEQAATRFQTRHGGQKAFQLGDMDDVMWHRLFPPKKK